MSGLRPLLAVSELESLATAASNSRRASPYSVIDAKFMQMAGLKWYDKSRMDSGSDALLSGEEEGPRPRGRHSAVL